MRESSFSYSPLAWEDNEHRSTRSHDAIKYGMQYGKNAAICILTLSTSLLLFLLINQTQSPGSIGTYYDSNGSERWQQYNWWSDYSSGDPQEQKAVDDLWDQIVPAHGIVAVKHDWAAERDLPASYSLPSDPSKGVYIIDAYHQIHCLTIVRKTFYQIVRNEPLTYPMMHSMHCFDSLRQYVTCTAGDTLLYSWGRNTTGDGQQRKCRNWSALRDWATEHTACYRDSTTPIPLLDHFEHCDGSTDGFLPVE